MTEIETKTAEMVFEKPPWQIWIWRATLLISVLLYTLICVNVPFALIPGGGHDDGLYMQHGYWLATGNWLGPYSQYTLMKGAGYPMFLALLFWFRIPVPLAQCLLYVFAVWLTALVIRKLSGSLLVTFAAFEFLLWNFGPESNRVVRDAVYHSQFLIAFSFLVLAFLEKRRIAYLSAAAAGLCFGWLWITREEGIVNVPAIALMMSYFVWRSWREPRLRQKRLVLAGVFIILAIVPALHVAQRNLRRYHKFETLDIHSDFAGTISALESIEQKNERPYVAISREVREKAYAASPTFGRLRKYFDDPGFPGILAWKDVGCHFLPTTCGDYGVGWFMWGLRDAAAIDGQFQDAQTSAAFFHAIRMEIEKACANGKLMCHHSLVPFLPHVTPGEVSALPGTIRSLFRKLLFLDPPPVQGGPSLGTPEQVRDAAIFTNIQIYTPPPEIRSAMMNWGTIRRAITFKTSFIKAYSWILPVIIPLGFLALLGGTVTYIVKREFPILLTLAWAAWVEIVVRFMMLALIDLTSFGAVFHLYMSVVFPLSCLASVISIYLAIRLLYQYLSLPTWFQRVRESSRPVEVNQ